MGSWQIKLYYHMHSFRINHVRILWTVWFTIPCKWTPDAMCRCRRHNWADEHYNTTCRIENCKLLLKNMPDNVIMQLRGLCDIWRHTVLAWRIPTDVASETKERDVVTHVWLCTYVVGLCYQECHFNLLSSSTMFKLIWIFKLRCHLFVLFSRLTQMLVTWRNLSK